MSFSRLILVMRKASAQADETTEKLHEVFKAYDAVRQMMANTPKITGSGKETADALLGSYLGGIPSITGSGGSALSPSSKSTGTTSPTTKTAVPIQTTAKIKSWRGGIR